MIQPISPSPPDRPPFTPDDATDEARRTKHARSNTPLSPASKPRAAATRGGKRETDAARLESTGRHPLGQAGEADKQRPGRARDAGTRGLREKARVVASHDARVRQVQRQRRVHQRRFLLAGHRFLCSNSPSEALRWPAWGTDISAAEAATDSDDDGRIVAEVISEDESEEAATPKPKLETLAARAQHRSRPPRDAAAEKEKKEKEEAEKAKKRRPVPGPGATTATTKTTSSTTTPASKKSAEKPPPSLKKLFEEEKDFLRNAVEGVKWATMGVAQLREEFAHRDHKKHRENASKFSAALDKKRETATRLRPKVAYGDITPINAQEEKEKFLWRGPRRQGSKKNAPRTTLRPKTPSFNTRIPRRLSSPWRTTAHLGTTS